MAVMVPIITVISITINETIYWAPTRPGTGRGAFIPYILSNLHSNPSKHRVSLICNSKIQKVLQNKRIFLTILVAKAVYTLFLLWHEHS